MSVATANWAHSDCGAEIEDVSYEATHVASGAANLLSLNEERLWMSGEAPQHVTVRVTSCRPPILFVGWSVRHHCDSSPKTVEVSSGQSVDAMNVVLVCEALHGPGSQLWRLPMPIPPSHSYIRLSILETFGAGPTFMNKLLLLSTSPDSRFNTYMPPASSLSPLSTLPSYTAVESSQRDSSTRVLQRSESQFVSMTGSTKASEDAPFKLGGSPLPASSMRQLLQDLNEDIRLLKPIKSITPKKALVLSLSPPDTENLLPTNFSTRDVEHKEKPLPSARVAAPSEGEQMSAELRHRLSSVELQVASLAERVNHHKEDLNVMKGFLLTGGSEARQNASSIAAVESRLSQLRVEVSSLAAGPPKSSSVATPSPLDMKAVRDCFDEYIDNCVDIMVDKRVRKLEKRLMQRLDHYLVSVIGATQQACQSPIPVSAPPTTPTPAAASTQYHYHFNSPSASSPSVQKPEIAEALTPPHTIPYFTVPPFPSWPSPALSIVRENDTQSSVSRK